MAAHYEELDHRRTDMGDLVLRRRRLPGSDEDIYEIKLDEALLMSSLLDASERALATYALDARDDAACDVLIGGLGLGHTAHAALAFDHVRSVTVVELLPAVLEWHAKGLVPLGAELSADPRCRFVRGDFFRILSEPAALSPPEDGYGAILVDIDHAPDAWLHPEHGRFYRASALAEAAALLRRDGAFALWSAGSANDAFVAALSSVFATVETHAVEVFNPMIDADQVDTIYVARPSSEL